MEDKKLEYRMYFFVPYNISPIQQAIQAGHAALEYAHQFKDHPRFVEFVEDHKTWIILNGGTTNGKGKPGANYREDTEPYLGTLDNIAHQVVMNGINYSVFQEPDLNNAVTAVCFICDERVFNYEDYPDLSNFITALDFNIIADILLKYDIAVRDIRRMTYEEIKGMFPTQYMTWQNDIMDGEKNVFLRNLLKGKKLA